MVEPIVAGYGASWSGGRPAGSGQGLPGKGGAVNHRPHPGVQVILALQAVILAGFALASLSVIFTTTGTVAEVIVFRMNILHSAILLAVAVLSGVALLHVRIARMWISAQTAGFMLLFIVGTALSANRPQDTRLALDAAGNLGHLTLGLIGLTLLLFVAGPWLTGNRVPGKPPADEQPVGGRVGNSPAR